MSHLIFISHIHEETEAAQAIQQAIEQEFSGFVDVFVSSDGKSIPPGANFLKRIEDSLTNCAGAIYLISPISVKRNWVNFELGAVWVRNSMSVKNSGPEIPTIPICHSGMTPGSLPMPLSNLNAINGNSASQLELAFKAIQNAVGGKGSLKTDFDELAKRIIDFEKRYTLGDNLVKLFNAISATTAQVNQVISQCKKEPAGSKFNLQLGFRENGLIQILRTYELNELKGYITITISNAGISMGTSGAINGADVEVLISRDLIIDFEKLLNDKFK
jgi:hypothetical protein